MLASAAGGVAGYAIGYFLYASIGEPIIAFYGYTEQFATFQGWYREYGAWIVAAGGFTPIPYKVITIASGVAQMDLGTFTVVSVVSRGARFRSEEHTSELQSLMRISYAVFCLKKKKQHRSQTVRNELETKTIP